MDILLRYFLQIPAIIIAIVLHEYTKAAASNYLGDPKPKKDGRLTLNPLRHIDPLGAICILIWGLGWGKPVETSPVYYKNRKGGILLVYTLPSLLNLIFGILMGFATFFINAGDALPPEAKDIVLTLFVNLSVVNISMALFNIIPVYPLDGAKVLSAFLKPATVIKMAQYEKVMQIILMFGVIAGYIGLIIAPITRAILGFTNVF